MSRRMTVGLALSAAMAVAQMGIAGSALAQEKGAYRVLSEHRLAGFVFPESVGCDAADGSLFVSQFGSELKPTLKDGKGFISRLSLDGKMIEEQFLPAHGEILNKPKGIWIQGRHLWVTDIDVVWEFDLKTRRGRKVALPNAKFANDPTVMDGALWVSDNRGDQLYRVEPANFLGSKRKPRVTVVFSGKSVNPNGLYPAQDGSLLMVGYASPKAPRPIFSLAPGSMAPKALTPPIGMLDGIAQLADGSLVVTNWVSHSVFRWSEKTGMETLATGFKGPADLCVIPRGDGYLLAVPDLPGSQVRLFELGK